MSKKQDVNINSIQNTVNEKQSKLHLMKTSYQDTM